MSIETDLNTSPYYDDFDETKNFHRILFRPSVPVQARELTQLQTILQNQVERFGENIYKEGTIIKGVSFSYDTNYQYIKLNDLREDGQPLNVAQHSGQYAVSTSNLIATIVKTESGLESQDPDLNTFFVKYLNTGTSDEKVYANTDLLTLYSTYTDALNANNSVAQVRVANSSFTAPVGSGYSFKVSDGIIFQKGHFVRVDEQDIVVSKYSTSPNNVSVGFVTQESVVNSSIDTTLLDNAAGFSNENAPGAHRLKLTPTLVTVNTDIANSSFFTLARWEAGRVTQQNQTTQFSSINRELARRTAEESGDYVVKPFGFSSKTGNTTHVNIVSGAGIAYINGHRVEQLDNVSIPTRKGLDTKVKEDQIISQNYGSYVIVDEYVGNFDFESGASISLRDTAADNVSDETFALTAPGSEIGTAKIFAITYHSGLHGTPTAKYRMYLTDIKMNSGNSFSQVKSLFHNGTNKGVADVVLENDSQGTPVAVLKETNLARMVYSFVQPAIKRLTNGAGTNNTKFIYRTSDEALQFNSSGQMTINAGTDVFPYTVSSTLSDVQEQDIIVVSKQSVAAANATGTVTVSSSNTVTGTGTGFISDFTIGDWVQVANSTASEYSRVTAIANNTSLSLATDITGPFSGDNIARYFPSGMSIPVTGRDSANVTIDGTGAIMTVDIGETLSSSMDAIAYYNLQRDSAKAVGKDVQKDIYIKIAVTSATVDGPWCLGLPDVYEITGIWRGTGTYSESNEEVINHFMLDSGQKDRFYGLAYLVKSPSSNLTISNGDTILVKVNCFKQNLTAGGRGFFSVDSYPIDDTTEPLPADKIRTEDIPLYTPASGVSLDLRNCVDFRPPVANTAAYANTIAGATVTPANTEAFSGTLFIPAPNENFQCDTEYYLGRIDKISMDSYGNHVLVEGIPSLSPVAPNDTDNAMLLAVVDIPPFPTLSLIEGRDSGRDDYVVTTQEIQYKRYTMNDINDLEDRISSLEYYTSLSLLEKETKDLVIPASDGTDRFKNGIFVDAMDDLSLTNQNDPETAIGHDPDISAIQPLFRQAKIDFDVSSTANTTVKGDVALLPYTETTIFDQNTATKSRTVTEAQWKWEGAVDMYPSHDIYFDVRHNPTIIVNDTTIINKSPPVVVNVTNNVTYPSQNTTPVTDPPTLPGTPAANTDIPAVTPPAPPTPPTPGPDVTTPQRPGRPGTDHSVNSVQPVITRSDRNNVPVRTGGGGGRETNVYAKKH